MASHGSLVAIGEESLIRGRPIQGNGKILGGNLGGDWCSESTCSFGKKDQKEECNL